MNILIDKLPSLVIIDDIEYEINTDFRISILFELLMHDNDFSEQEKICTALELYYPVVPDDIEIAIDKILWFYRCGKDIKSSKASGNSKSSQIYSYEYDDDYIYSAFLDQYGVDLQDIKHLHWWKFKAMFKSLKEDNEIVKIMGYRAMDITKVDDKNQKSFYAKMKKLHEIPISKNEEEKINLIEQALLNGDSIDGLL